MPIGRNCRSCGASLPTDLSWCTSCYAAVTPFAARPPLHEPGSFVGSPIREYKTSRWRSSPTTMGPLGRIGWTVGLLLFAPWWALAVPMRSIWRKERVADDAPPTLMERFRERHPGLGTQIHLGSTARLVILAMAAIAVVVILLTKDGVDRYLFAAPLLVVGLMVSLAKWNDV